MATKTWWIQIKFWVVPPTMIPRWNTEVCHTYIRDDKNGRTIGHFLSNSLVQGIPIIYWYNFGRANVYIYDMCNAYCCLQTWLQLFTHATVLQESEESLFLLLHDNLTFVIEFVFMPKRTVRQVQLTRSRTDREIRHFSFVVSPSFVSPGFGNLSFRMCHDSLNYCYLLIVMVVHVL